MARVNSVHQLDEKSKAIIYEGASASQMAQLFKISELVLRSRMVGIQPVGTRGNAHIYDVAEVAKNMTQLTEEQVMLAMRKMHASQLPPGLQKEVWNALRAKQNYEAAEGDLWSTDQVIAEAGGLVKELSMALNLLSDSVAREYDLSEGQRQLIIKMVDGAKANMMKRLKEKFVKKARKPLSKDKSLSQFEDDDEL